MAVELRIRAAELRDAGDYADHVKAHMAESGKDGMPIFAPGESPSREEARDNAKVRWARRLTEANWGRAWVLEEIPGAGIVGHIELRGGRLPAELHRATLGMGILRAFTRRGHGPRLMDVVLTWARAETPLVWIDLGVFANNEPAIKLYERTGFVRQTTRKDAFRNDEGISIDDIHMTLRIR